ncbi:F-box/kelch-repeat protein [Cardamine amara subsp. amara]|uniref:F-box/kelch-repeat protein n=1 Tax=Cardamine amara subsp. amara TaxID=228776 RepID=A0ABD1ABY5_CARAN
MSSSEKKRKWRTKRSPKSTPNPSLPDDLVVSCLARVSRLYYPNLSLVSKSFRSILASPELYKTRTLLGRTETFLYVCLHFPEETNPRWFTLYRKPNPTLTNYSTQKKKKKMKKKEGSSCNLLTPIPVLNSLPLESLYPVVVGSNLYAISAAIEDSPCSNVTFLDCRTQTWLEAPRMRLAQTNGEFEGKMYLAGSSENTDSMNFVEVYNTKTQTWKTVSPEKRIFKLGNLEGKIYMNFDVESHRERVAFKPKDLTWEVLGIDADLDGVSICMIENITYSYIGMFAWRKFNTKGAAWRSLKGLEGLPKFASESTVKMADYGGKLVVLWDEYKEKIIWCAEISLEKRKNEEIWGKLEWFDAVLTVPKSYKFECAVAATV